MSKLLSKEFYGNHYYLNIDSEIGSVSGWQQIRGNTISQAPLPSRQAAVRQPVRPPRTTFHIYDHLSKPRQHEKIQNQNIKANE